jgi:hypothetical protein
MLRHGLSSRHRALPYVTEFNDREPRSTHGAIELGYANAYPYGRVSGQRKFMVTSRVKSSAGTHLSEMASRPCLGGR